MNFQSDPAPIQWLAALILATVLNFVTKQTAHRPLAFAGIALSVAGLAMHLSGVAFAGTLALFGLGLLTAPLAPMSGTLALLFGVVSAGTFGGAAQGTQFFLQAATFAAGLALGGFLVDGGKSATSPALVVMTLGAADALGHAQLGALTNAPGLLLAGGVLIASLVGEQLSKPALRLAAPAVLIAALFFGLSVQVFQFSEVGLCAVLGALVAVVLAWVLPEENPVSPSTALLCGILMLAVGTIAFSEARGLGMAVAALASLAIALAGSLQRLTAVIAPLSVLAIFRAFGVTFPEAARALDIGQHYGMIGCLAGILACLLISEIAAHGRPVATLLAAISGGVACGASALLIGSKGAVGLLAGLGLGSVVGLISDRTSRASGAMVLAIGSLLIGYPLLKDRMDLTRAEKLPMLAMFAAVVLICGVAAAFSVRPTQENPAESA